MSNPIPQPQLAYRRDIDGLRAVAILSVLGFHTFPSLVRGGFVGVDVFFVISGYLITGIITAGLRDGRFSLRHFYARRVRRIFPALILVLTVCYAFGWLVLLADEYTQLSKHIAAAAGFSVNFALWAESGYFDTEGALKPLLHLWSLGVEEQFYIVWPFLLWLGWKRRINLLLLALSILAISLWLGVRTTAADASAAFYSPLTRWWEVLVGGVLALGSTSARPAFEDVKSSIGLLLIVAAVLGLSSGMPFPGWWALVPTLGAFLMIAAGPHAWVNRRLLSHPLMVWVGLISYPLYLWHWPLLVFARIHESVALPRVARVFAVLASFILASLTCQLLERPARRGGARVVALLVVLMGAVGSVGLYTVKRNGFDMMRFPASLQAYANFKYESGVDPRGGRCWLPKDQPFANYADECVDRGAPEQPLVFIWGDSHAGRLYTGIRQAAGARYRLAQFARDSCPPLIVWTPGVCVDSNALVLEKIRQTQPAVVVLFAAWAVYSTDWHKESVAGQQLLDTAAALAGVPRIIIVGPSPRWEKNLPRIVFEAAARDPLHRAPRRTRLWLDPSYAGIDAAFRTLLAGLPVTYFSVRDAMCDGEGCLTQVGEGADTLVSWDYGHFTTAGATYIAERLLPAAARAE